MTEEANNIEWDVPPYFEWTTLADVEGNEFCVVQLGVGSGWSQPELRARTEAVGQPSAAPGNS